MRQTFLALLIFLNISFNPENKESRFYQDVAIIHGTDVGLPEEPILEIHLNSDKPVVLLQNQSYIWDGNRWGESKKIRRKKSANIQNLPKESGILLTSTTFKGRTIAGCTNGLFIQTQESNWERLLPADNNYSWSPKNVSALTVDSNDNLWIGGQQGVGKFDGVSWKLFTGKEGLPYNHFTCASSGLNGIVWFGTEKGAIRVEDDHFYYRFSRRWLPNDHVNDITVDKSGTAWIATNVGISQIVSKFISFEEKAAFFTKQVEDRHNRMGFVCQSKLTEQYNLETSQLDISDNDGLYTALYGSAQAFRYAITGDKKAKELADRSFKACKWLVDITHEPGFPARVIIPIDYHDPVNEEYSREFNRKMQQKDPFWKDIYPRFPKSKDGKYRYKCDTSSDELAGHYFFYGIYYDLVAETDEEKDAVKQVVGDITDHLIRNGFLLRDYDGKPTRWGNFSPEFCNSIWGWDQRGLNSMMMLSFLNVAKHVTGDPKYDETAAMLRDKHNYHINAMHAKEFFPPDNVVPWDNNLSLMSLYGLIKYEEDPELLIMYRNSLENTWLHISKQNNSFWDALYGATANSFKKKVDDPNFRYDLIFPENPLYAKAALQEYHQSNVNPNFIKRSLQQIPLDLIGYKMDNTHRLDIVLDPTPGENPDMGWRTDGFALPIDERGHVRVDRDGFALIASEGNGFSENEGTFYLLPYYLSVYHKLIQK